MGPRARVKPGDDVTARVLIVVLDVQLLLGIALYAVSPTVTGAAIGRQRSASPSQPC